MRLFITGPTGSGKTTLAKKISAQTGIPVYSLDDIHWVQHPDGDRRRGADERAVLLSRIVEQDVWIIEGVQFKWSDAAMERAHHIMVLDLAKWRNLTLIGKRFLKRRFSGTFDRRGTLAALREELQWSEDYYDGERQLLFEKLRQWQDKTIITRSSGDAIYSISEKITDYLSDKQ